MKELSNGSVSFSGGPEGRAGFTEIAYFAVRSPALWAAAKQFVQTLEARRHRAARMDLSRMTKLSFHAVAGCPHLAHVAYLKRWLPRAVKLIKNAPDEVSIALLGETKMAALHVQFMNIQGPTDVLTFEMDHDRRGRVISGEVVVCPSIAKKEARRRGVDADREILLYALHGVLHLSGHDDLTPKDYARMHKEEDRILRAIGIGEVFAIAAGPSRQPTAQTPRRRAKA